MRHRLTNLFQRPFAWILAATVLAAGFPALALAGDPQGRPHKLDPQLRIRSAQLGGRSRVIVQFSGTPDVRVFGNGRAGRRLGHAARAGEVDNAVLAALAEDPRVERVSLDRPVFATLERTGAATGAGLAAQALGLTGSGIGVAVIDSGVAGEHPDLDHQSHAVVYARAFTADGATTVFDDYGHGTHVAGIIAGSGFLSRGARAGVAPGASLVALKVLDAQGHGYISDVIAAIDHAIAVRHTYNIRVINLSVASGVYESFWLDPLALAAKRAVDAGIVVVAAAGNLGLDDDGEPQHGGITSPGNAPWVLTVGAASHEGTRPRSDDTIAGFSSRGPTWIDFAAKPDLVAPGVGIESLASPGSELSARFRDYLLDGARLQAWDDPYLSLSGTSMAAPVVSGTVALMLEANPALTPNAVKAILQYTAQARGQHPLVEGAGLLNAIGAVRLARFFADPQSDLGPLADSIEGETVVWARHIIWGNYRITGGFLLPGSSAWTTGLRWGALQTPTGAPVVWGVNLADNIVWSTNAADNIVWSTTTGENIVWSTTAAENIVWSTDAAGNIVWSTTTGENIVWSTAGAENIVWSTSTGENIVWSTNAAENIVWSTTTAENIVWSTTTADNIVWSTATVQNVVWGMDCGGRNCGNVIWGAQIGGVVWGTATALDNIVWSTAIADNIVWSTATGENIVWSTTTAENIVWSTEAGANIVWSTTTGENIVWSTSTADNIVWSTSVAENIVWSTAALEPALWPAGM
jgi:serine protease AprX